MKIRAKLTAISFIIFLSVSTISSAVETTVFKNVNVVPMNEEVVLENHTVVVENGVITALGVSGSVKLPVNTEIIDGKDAFLMPGLADMHAHLYAYERDPGHLILYLAEGTTTVRSLSGTPYELEWRERIENGELIGPSIYTSGPTIVGNYDDAVGFQGISRIFHIVFIVVPLIIGTIIFFLVKLIIRLFKKEKIRVPRKYVFLGIGVLLVVGFVLTLVKVPSMMVLAPIFDKPDGYVSETPFHVVREVRSQKKRGYDLIKVYDGLTEKEYLAATAEAKKLGIYVVGHAPNQILLETVVTSGQDELAHVDELLSYHWIGYNRGLNPDPSIKDHKYPVDYDLIPHTVALVKDNDIPVVSNLVTDEILYRLILDTPGVLAGSEYRVVREHYLDHWKTSARTVTVFKDQGPYRRDVLQPFLMKLINELHDAGVIITIGVDATVEGSVPGFHTHRELELLVEAGLTNYEALESGTKNAGTIVNRMGLDGNFGTIEVGMRADLILVKGNPLEDVTNTRNRIGVMAQGNWYTQEELDAMISKYISSY